jgi:predicted exporter
LRFTPLVLVLLAVLAWFAIDHKQMSWQMLWDDQLSSLSPVAADRIARDGQLRSASATFDMRYQLRLQAASLEELLLECEQLEHVLTTARDDGLLSGWSSPCLLLPSQQLQAQRKAQIPSAKEMQQRLQQALSDSPFKADAFQPFEQTLQSAQAAFPLKPADFEQGPLAAWLDAHLLQIDEQWFALVNLADPQAEALAERIAPLAPTVNWMDLQLSSTQMMQDFRHEATRAVALAALAILLMLALARTRPRRLLWIVLTALASLGLTLAVIILVHHAINLVHLVALLLVLGLGLDYSLFLSREDARADPAAARHSIIACALSTTLAFGILAGSSIPMLSFIGLTVATGSFSAFVLAMLGSRQRLLSAAA